MTNKYEMETWYTLEDIIKSLELESLPFSNNTPDLLSIIYKITPEINLNHISVFENGAFKPFIEELWKYSYARYMKEYAINNLDNIRDFFIQILVKMDLSYERYSTILNSYKSLEGLLLEKLSTENESQVKFNDTPQQVLPPNIDPFTTNITKSNSKTQSDVMTPIQKLSEIRREYGNIMKEWSNDFEELFIYGGNI